MVFVYECLRWFVWVVVVFVCEFVFICESVVVFVCAYLYIC